MYIGNHIDLQSLSKHTLLVNFRNPKDTVAMLNRIFGYEMRANSTQERSIKIVQIGDLPENLTATSMSWTKTSSKIQTEDEKNTIRSNQGRTVKNTVLYCTANDATLMTIEELQIVGLSRHTEMCYIVTDGCVAANKLIAQLFLDTNFYDHLNTWLTFPKEDARPLIVGDKVVDIVIKPQQPPKDMYKLVETFVPSAAFDEDSTSMNNYGSQLVQDNFVTGVTLPDLLIMPTNKRNDPVVQEEVYYSIGQEIGNHFPAKKPIQTLQVLQARYFKKQPFFKLGQNKKKLATKLFDKWFAANIKPGFRDDCFNDLEIQAVIDKFLTHITQRSYQSSFLGSGGYDNPQGEVIRFQL